MEPFHYTKGSLDFLIVFYTKTKLKKKKLLQNQFPFGSFNLRVQTGFTTETHDLQPIIIVPLYVPPSCIVLIYMAMEVKSSLKLVYLADLVSYSKLPPAPMLSLGSL